MKSSCWDFPLPKRRCLLSSGLLLLPPLLSFLQRPFQHPSVEWFASPAQCHHPPSPAFCPALGWRCIPCILTPLPSAVPKLHFFPKHVPWGFQACEAELKAAAAGESPQDAFPWGLMGKALRLRKGWCSSRVVRCESPFSRLVLPCTVLHPVQLALCCRGGFVSWPCANQVPRRSGGGTWNPFAAGSVFWLKRRRS